MKTLRCVERIDDDHRSKSCASYAWSVSDGAPVAAFDRPVRERSVAMLVSRGIRNPIRAAHAASRGRA